MIIAIDLIGTNLESGTKTFNLNLLKQILNSDNKTQINIFICKSYMKYIDIRNIPQKINLITKPNFLSISFIKILWMQLLLPFELKILRIDKIYSPMNYCPLICKFFNLQIILGIHSNLPWVYYNKMPGSKIKNFFIKNLMFLSIKACDKLIVNSKFAKNELKKKLNLKSKSIFVNYLGVENKIKNISTYSKSIKFNFKSSYILSVSSCVRYHNLINILKAFKKTDEKRKKLKLVIIMQILDQKYFKEINNYVKKNFKNKKVLFFNNLETSIVNKFYKNCLFYIFSSYSEVFGLTTLEAMSNNAPLMLSNSSALPEINGKAALYFDPDNVEDIKCKMNKFIKNKNLRNIYIKRGLSQIKKYDWNKMYQSLIKIIKK